MSSERSYKTIDKDIIKSFNIQVVKTYFYYNKNNKVYLNEKQIDELHNSEIYYLDDGVGTWYQNKNETKVYLSLEFKINNVYKIFVGPTKCVFKMANIGIGLEWRSVNSKIKQCVKIGEFNYQSEDDITFKIENIELNDFTSDIIFTYFFYIVDVPKKDQTELKQRYADLPGLIIADSLLWEIKNTGNGSVFPIIQEAIKNGPLWSIKCNFNDWSIDNFDTDYICISLNELHPLFNKIDSEHIEYDHDVFIEVISSALFSLIVCIIECAKKNGEYDLLFDDVDKEYGSILDAMKYFKNIKGFVFNNNSALLLESIKKYCEKEF